jgi:hypothetical protein
VGSTSVLEVGLLAGCMMFSSFLSAPVFLKLVLILSGVIFKPTVYHPLCGVSCWFVFGGFAVVFSFEQTCTFNATFILPHFFSPCFQQFQLSCLGLALAGFFIDVFTY